MSLCELLAEVGGSGARRKRSTMRLLRPSLTLTRQSLIQARKLLQGFQIAGDALIMRPLPHYVTACCTMR